MEDFIALIAKIAATGFALFAASLMIINIQVLLFSKEPPPTDPTVLTKLLIISTLMIVIPGFVSIVFCYLARTLEDKDL